MRLRIDFNLIEGIMYFVNMLITHFFVSIYKTFLPLLFSHPPM